MDRFSVGNVGKNRKAKYYSITKSGRKQLARETENWERIAGVIGRLLKLEG
jgi:PadR family transcriptional regulator, regulatory protein PadR